MILALVPARAGSKRVPKKNTRRIGGRSLVQIACEQGLTSRLIDGVVVSTDSEDIANEVGANSRTIVVRRPTRLALDETPMVDVLIHFLEQDGPSAETLVLLQPTSPLRTTEDIDGAIKLYQSSGADTVVSVVQVPHQYSPDKLMTLDADLRTQAIPETRVPSEGAVLFSRNGPAVLVTSPESIHRSGLYGPVTVGYEMPLLRSIDINSEEELILCDLLYGSKVHGSAP